MPALEGNSSPEANGASGLSAKVMEMLQSMERMQHELATKIDLQQAYLKTMAGRWHGPHVSEGDCCGPTLQPIPSVAPPQCLDDDEDMLQEKADMLQEKAAPPPDDTSEKEVAYKRSVYGSFRIREDADCLTRFAAGPCWAFLCFLLIILNTAMIGAETQLNTQYSLGIALYRQGIGDDVPVPVNMEFFQIADLCFLIWMVIEVCVNAYAQRWEFLFGADKWWNAFDVMIVLLSVLTQLLEAVSITFLRVIRLFRLGKILRAFKVIKWMRGVRSMIISMAGSMQHLASACLVMCIFMYVVTLIFMQGISADALQQTGGTPEPGAVVRRGNITKAATHHSLSVFEFAAGYEFGTHWEATEVLYGSVDQAMMTLFLSISSGLTWSLAAEPLSKLGTFYGAVWTGFMFFTVFGLLNVLTGIFVDAAIKAMMNDRENMIATQIEERDSLVKVILGVFKTSDEDGSGMITSAEFEKLLMDEELVYYLQAIGIDSSEARHLFRLLDDDKSGMVSIDEFVTGFLKLKGSAKAVDLATLMYEQRKILKKIDNLSKRTNHLHQGLNCLQTTGSGSGKVACTNVPEPNASDRGLSRVLNEISGLLGRNTENLAQVVPTLIDNAGVLQSSAIQVKSGPAGAPDNHEVLIQLGRTLLSHVEGLAIDCVAIRVELEQQRKMQSDIQHTTMQTVANLEALRNVLGDMPASGFTDDAKQFGAKQHQAHFLLPLQDELRAKCLQAETEVKGLLQTLQTGMEWMEKSRVHVQKITEAHIPDRQKTLSTLGKPDDWKTL